MGTINGILMGVYAVVSVPVIKIFFEKVILKKSQQTTTKV